MTREKPGHQGFSDRQDHPAGPAEVATEEFTEYEAKKARKELLDQKAEPAQLGLRASRVSKATEVREGRKALEEREGARAPLAAKDALALPATRASLVAEAQSVLWELLARVV